MVEWIGKVRQFVELDGSRVLLKRGFSLDFEAAAPHAILNAVDPTRVDLFEDLAFTQVLRNGERLNLAKALDAFASTMDGNPAFSLVLADHKSVQKYAATFKVVLADEDQPDGAATANCVVVGYGWKIAAFGARAITSAHHLPHGVPLVRSGDAHEDEPEAGKYPGLLGFGSYTKPGVKYAGRFESALHREPDPEPVA
jgi:hypothetical protein